MNSGHYTADYFSSGLFSQNYQALADAILSVYQPTRILDVGCGPGALSRAFARRAVSITAIDAFADPNFTEHNIQFHRCNLNSPRELTAITKKIGSQFDITVCLEVAEHLEPAASDQLVRFLCASAPIVIFSAAVPGQGGAGHINCEHRTAWHDRFIAAGFYLNHQVRPKIIAQPDIPTWYRFNTLDYVRAIPSSMPPIPDIRTLLTCESTIASSYYTASEEIVRLKNLLNLPSVRVWLNLRNTLKRWLRKP